jgi:hypothetical protein
MPVGTDIEILRPLKELKNSSKELEVVLLNLNIIVTKLQELLPFSNEKSKKIKKILRGGLFSPTSKNLRKLENAYVKTTDSVNELNAKIRKPTPDSSFSKILFLWLGKRVTGSRSLKLGLDNVNKVKVSVFTNSIIKYLSINSQGIIFKAINIGKLESVKEEQIKYLYAEITAYLVIMKKMNDFISDLEDKYKTFGLNKTF